MYTQWQEDRDYELMARYDYLNEAFGPSAIDWAGMDDAPEPTPEEVLASALMAAPYYRTPEEEAELPF